MVNPLPSDGIGEGSGDRMASIPPAIAAYLTLDIQDSREWAQELAGQIAAVRSGELDHWERLGNAYELVLTSDGATIAATVGPEEGDRIQVALADLAEAV
ncbi:MAG: YacL family protein, partial [Cyanobacteria bacterium P01_H01_bin.130]